MPRVIFANVPLMYPDSTGKLRVTIRHRAKGSKEETVLVLEGSDIYMEAALSKLVIGWSDTVNIEITPNTAKRKVVVCKRCGQPGHNARRHRQEPVPPKEVKVKTLKPRFGFRFGES